MTFTIHNHIPGHISFELDRKAEEFPDLEILTFENESDPDIVLTYSDIVLNGRRFARRLLTTGIGKGDVFALVMQNQPEFIYCLYAATLLGAILLPIDPRIKGEPLVYMLRDSNCKGIILSSDYLQNIEQALEDISGIPIIAVSYASDEEKGLWRNFPSVDDILNTPEFSPPYNRSNEIEIPVEIVYTSGTTGPPKGVVIHGNRLSVYSVLAEFVWQYTSDDTLYTGLSLAHGNAQAVTLMPSLLMSVPSVFSKRFTKSRIWDICRTYGCTSFSLLGSMAMGLYSEPLKADDFDNPVRLVVSAGTPQAIWEPFESRFGVMIHEWYAAVEGGFAHKPPGFGPIGSFGKPLEGATEMKVVREDDSDCDPGETGEIICRMIGRNIEVEYVGMEEESLNKTRGGWLRSEDMGHVDENGWFFFDYRKGGALRRAGEFLQPETIESTIATHPDVNDICVFGIPSDSGAPGESDVVAAILPANGKPIDLPSVIQHCRKNLEGNAIPSYYQVVEELPKTISEKNMDRLLRTEFRPDAENVFHITEYL